jgi:Ni/Co efflux regulator RcnB
MRMGMRIALAAVGAAALMAGAGPAAAGVTGCKASGGKQEAGAVIGAVVGGVLGNRVASHDRGVGTVVGAAGGAAAGSAIGCEMQKKDAQKRAASGDGYGGYEVGDRIPASYVRDRRYRLDEPWKYRLRPAPAGYRWMNLDGDAYLVRTDTGRIKDVARGVADQ